MDSRTHPAGRFRPAAPGAGAAHGRARRAGVLALLAGVLLLRPCAAEAPPEYRLKAAFLYNFALFTEWPATVGPVLKLCVLGKDPFGAELDALQGKSVGQRTLAVRRLAGVESARECSVIFVAASAMASGARLVEDTRGAPVLTVADSAGAIDLGIALNMSVNQDKIAFDANLAGPRAGGLKLSSKLLRLAREVRQ